MKQRYEKPSMKVYELKQKPMILAGSGNPNGYPGNFGYMPGQPHDESHLA